MIPVCPVVFARRVSSALLSGPFVLRTAFSNGNGTYPAMCISYDYILIKAAIDTKSVIAVGEAGK
jgi:hypothetical protein